MQDELYDSDGDTSYDATDETLQFEREPQENRLGIQVERQDHHSTNTEAFVTMEHPADSWPSRMQEVALRPLPKNNRYILSPT